MTYAFVPADSAHTGGHQSEITRVVLHATVSPCKPGGARQVANYFQTASAGGAAHYVVDPAEVIACVPEDIVAYHAPPNHGSIGIELCDPQTGLDARWGDKNHTAMFNLAAPLVADLCRRHNVPPSFVDAAGLLAGKAGITTHAEVVQAWHQSDHTDPGPGFPMGRFIDLVHQANPTPTPAPESTVTDDEIEKVAQRVFALLKPYVATHQDMVVLLRGTQDGKHAANLTNIARALNVEGA